MLRKQLTAATLAIAAVASVFFPATVVADDGDRSKGSKKKAKYALLVGITNYQSDLLRDLHGCENDVEDFAKLLTDCYDFPADDAHIKKVPSKEATRENILAQFKQQLIENARKEKAAGNSDAVFVFYYSGHGGKTKDLNGDEEDGVDETIVPVDSRVVGSSVFDITDDELNELFDELSKNTNNITFVLDSCHSGTATRSAGSPKSAGMDERSYTHLAGKAPASSDGNSKGSDFGQVVQQETTDLPRSRKYVTISGCLPSQLSEEWEFPIDEKGNIRKNGLLTGTLIQVIRNGRKDLTYQQLIDEVAPKVSSKVSSQTPQVEGDVNRVLFGGKRRHISAGGR